MATSEVAAAPVEPDDAAEEQAPPPRLVLGVRPPDAVSWRIHGPLEPKTAIETGASVSCTTTFTARKAERAALAGSSTPQTEPHGVLGGPMPARSRSSSQARVMVEVGDVVVFPGEGYALDLEFAAQPEGVGVYGLFTGAKGDSWKLFFERATKIEISVAGHRLVTPASP
ncbi:hypothetical protein DB30_00751 [Enhygromyxa salina]|uniref:Uncharacterized protein n=1 Tax=Enhygromyxa salina TaxID=215803 RepID=A0A0C2D5K6_9BACT|nr:hypothetical protein [Enhygromyxa salina]KIG18466.1 hypothetical protein DB30_00751 [Enhygromyxa salina]